MSLWLAFHAEALRDFEEAQTWYEARRPGLGDQFVTCVEAVIEGIRRNPRLYQPVHRDVRRGVVRRFPYGVLYVIRGEKILVLAVFHAKRDPRGWVGRL